MIEVVILFHSQVMEQNLLLVLTQMMGMVAIQVMYAHSNMLNPLPFLLALQALQRQLVLQLSVLL